MVGADVLHSPVLPQGGDAQRVAQVGLARAGHPGDQTVLSFIDPLAGGKLLNRRRIEFSRRIVYRFVQIGGGIPQGRFL